MTSEGSAKLAQIRTGAGSNQVQYNINAPVSVDGGSGFDKLVGGMQFFGPANIPRPVLMQVNAELARTLRQPDIARLFVDNGNEVLASSPEEHARSVRELYDTFGALIAELGIRLD